MFVSIIFGAKVQNKSDNNGKKAKNTYFCCFPIFYHTNGKGTKNHLFSARTGKYFVLKIAKWRQIPMFLFRNEKGSKPSIWNVQRLEYSFPLVKNEAHFRVIDNDMVKCRFQTVGNGTHTAKASKKTKFPWSRLRSCNSSLIEPVRLSLLPKYLIAVSSL